MTTDLAAGRGDVRVSLDAVAVSFPIYEAGSRSLKKRALFHGSGGRIGRDTDQRIIVEALRDVRCR